MTLFDTVTPAEPLVLDVKGHPVPLVNGYLSGNVRKLVGQTPDGIESVRVGSCVCERGVRLELTETSPWSGEYRLVAQRGQYWRDYLTENAHNVLGPLVAAAVHRYGGFDLAWRAAHRSSEYHDEAASVKKLAAAQVMLDYWQQVVDVRALVDGNRDVEYRYDPEPFGRHHRKIAVASERDTRDWAWAQVDVRVLIGGEQVAWLDTEGRFWPTVNDLAQHLAAAEGR